MNNLGQIEDSTKLNIRKNFKSFRRFFFSSTFTLSKEKAKMSDLELVSLNLTAEYLSIDSELQLFRKIPNSLKNKIERSVYNKRKRNLFYYINQIREKLYLFKKKRKRIETLFFQLCDQFMIKRNYAKSLISFKTRIISKITALTLIQYINKFVLKKEINKIKASII